MRILTVILLLLAFCACSDEWKKKDEVTGDGLKRGTAYEILEGRGNYTIFLEAIDRTGIYWMAKDCQPFLCPMIRLFKLISPSMALQMDWMELIQ